MISVSLLGLLALVIGLVVAIVGVLVALFLFVFKKGLNLPITTTDPPKDQKPL